MYIEKVCQNLYGVDIIVNPIKKLYEIEKNSVVHLVCHHTNDQREIEACVRVLLEKGCEIFHLFGEYSEVWADVLMSYSKDQLVIVDYYVYLGDFIMDIYTHFIEERELKQYNKSIDFNNRLDYIIYDDYGFYCMILEDLDEAEAIEDAK